MNTKIICKKCGRVHTYREFLVNRFCRSCGSWLSLNVVDFEELFEFQSRKYGLVSRECKVQRRINRLVRDLPRYLDVFHRSCPFNYEQWLLHVQTINLRRKLGSISKSLRNSNFVSSLYRTLETWRLNARGARLLPLKEFRKVLLENEEEISALENLRIDDEDLQIEEVAASLWRLIDDVRVSKARNPIVSGSKTFHHLLPELVPLIDRKYIRPFFMFQSTYFQYNPEKVFPYIWEKFASIAQRTNLKMYINRAVWNTSITKIMDNAIIGYCKIHKIPKRLV